MTDHLSKSTLVETQPDCEAPLGWPNRTITIYKREHLVFQFAKYKSYFGLQQFNSV